MPGVDLEHPLALHVGLLAGVGEGLGLHDPLHVGAPPVLARDHHAGAAGQTVADLHGVDVVRGEGVLPPLGQVLEGLLEVLALGVLPQGEPLLGHVLELLVLVVHQVLHQVLVHRVGEEDDLRAATTEGRRVKNPGHLPGDGSKSQRS